MWKLWEEIWQMELMNIWGIFARDEMRRVEKLRRGLARMWKRKNFGGMIRAGIWLVWEFWRCHVRCSRACDIGEGLFRHVMRARYRYRCGIVIKDPLRNYGFLHYTARNYVTLLQVIFFTKKAPVLSCRLKKALIFCIFTETTDSPMLQKQLESPFVFLTDLPLQKTQMTLTCELRERKEFCPLKLVFFFFYFFIFI